MSEEKSVPDILDSIFFMQNFYYSNYIYLKFLKDKYALFFKNFIVKSPIFLYVKQYIVLPILSIKFIKFIYYLKFYIFYIFLNLKNMFFLLFHLYYIILFLFN